MNRKVWRLIKIIAATGIFAGLCTAQTPACAEQSSFQFPLWSDATKWNLPGLYNSIQLADIDGDGQDELLGYGPFGIEVWHWEQNGQAWLKMTAGTPRFGEDDVLMTADVDGDGQAEIIQITPNTKTNGNPVVNVWRYQNVTQAWQYQPRLQLTLNQSKDSDSTTLTPMIQFADLNQSGRKELVHVVRSAGALTPMVYQVNTDSSGWGSASSASMSIPASDLSLGGAFKIGDVTGDGRPDLVYRVGGKGFVFFTQTASTASGAIAGFSKGEYITLRSPFLPNFELAKTGNFPSNPWPNRSYIFFSRNGQLIGLAYLPGEGLLGEGNSFSRPPLQPADAQPNEYLTLRKANTGFGTNSTADSIMVLTEAGLQEFGNPGNGGLLSQISLTPFVSRTRFGDDASDYTTIQTGHVRYGIGGVLQAIVVARDAAGVHTLVRSSNVCASGTAGFQLPQATYFPSFTGGKALAYSYISNLLVKGNFDIRKLYTNNFASLPSYEATLIGLTFPAGKLGIRFTQADFDFVKAQLNAEFLAAGNAVAFFNTSNFQLNNLFNGEEAVLPGILTALGLPTDETISTSDPAGAIFGDILIQVVSTFFFGLGSAPDAAKHLGVSTDSFNAAAIGVSMIGNIVDDVATFQDIAAGGQGSFGGQTLVVQNQVSDWHAAAATLNATAQTKALKNWDVMRMLSQQIGDGTLSLTSIAEDNAVNAGLNKFQIDTWRALAPQVWSIYGIAGDNANPANIYIVHPKLSGYPYLVLGSDASFPGICCGSPIYWAVWPELTASSSVIGDSHPTVPQAAMEQLTKLGVDFRDVLARRNGWEDIPIDTTPGSPLKAYPDYFAIPVITPPPPDQPVIGAPAILSILGGGQETELTDVCEGFDPTPIFTQSTPVGSIFPAPLLLAVSDADGNGVPGVTIEVDAPFLNPTQTTVVTDADGFASTTLLATYLSAAPYLATVKVISPTPDPTFPACASMAHYQLQNMPGLTGGNSGLIITSNLAAKAGTAANETLTVLVKDAGMFTTAMTLNSLSFNPKGSTTCSATLMTPLPIPMTGPDAKGNYTANVVVNASSCAASGPLNRFTMNVGVTGSVTLTDGVSYEVTSSDKASVFLP